MEKKFLAILGISIGLLIGGLSVYFYIPKAEPKEITLYGNVDIREVDLGFRVFGKIKALYVEEGDRVEEGTLLAQLDPTPYEEKLSQGMAQLDLAKVVCNNAKLQLTRREKALITQAVSEESVTNAQASYAESEAALARSTATLSVAQTELEDTKLIAPCRGTILSRIREPGSVLNPGLPVYTLSLDSPVWIRAYISEVDLGKVFPGMKAKIYTDSAKNLSYEGQVGFISPVAEFTPKNVETTDLRTELVYRLRIFIDQPDQGLRQGMPVTVQLQGG